MFMSSNPNRVIMDQRMQPYTITVIKMMAKSSVSVMTGIIAVIVVMNMWGFASVNDRH